MRPALSDAFVAVTTAAIVSGGPSTAAALSRRQPVFAATRAAGTLLGRPTVVRGVVAHVVVSVFWGAVLARALPHGNRTWTGMGAGAGIAALDLGVVARGFPAIRALPQLPQWADHLVFGAVLGAVLDAKEREHACESRASI